MSDKHLIIIGGGPGGYAAALVASQKNIKVTLFEKDCAGGTCLNRGCIPTKALLASSHLFEKIKNSQKFGINVENVSFDLNAIVERKNKVVETMRTSLEGLLKRRNVTVLKEYAKILSPRKVSAGGEEYTCDNIIIATGSEVMRIWDDKYIITSDEAIFPEALPSSLLVVGAGAVGLELACFYSQLGTKVTVVEMMDRILPSMDKDITDTLMRELKKKGISIKTGCKIEKIDGENVSFSDGKTNQFSTILQAVGRKANTENIGLENLSVTLEKGRIKTDTTMETSEKGVYAIGDIVHGYPQLAHSASAQGVIAALNIAGQKTFFNDNAIPGCIYTYPEAASVGLREDEIEEPIVSKVQFRTMGRAHAEGEIAGLIKIVADKDSKVVKGVHIVGERATDIIHEGVIAVSKGITIDDLADCIHAHPTFAEIYAEAFHLAEGRPIHVI